MRRLITTSLALAVLTLPAMAARADEAASGVPPTAGKYVLDKETLILAANDDAGTTARKPNGLAPASNQDYESSWLTGSKVHQYLGISTIVAAALTAMTHPEDEHHSAQSGPRETNGTHAKLAEATVALAAATIVTGAIVHWDDLHLDDGITDPDTLHVILGVTGAALMAYAVNKSKISDVPVSHAGVAELGALGMVAAIKLTW